MQLSASVSSLPPPSAGRNQGASGGDGEASVSQGNKPDILLRGAISGGGGGNATT